MEVILKKDLINLGEEGDIKKVKNGYARNYLIPQGLAVIANSTNLRILEKHRAEIEERKAKKREESKSVVERLNGKEIEIKANAGDSGKLFGSVSSNDIAIKLNEEGFEIDRKKIDLPHAIKMIGRYDAKVKFYEGITADISINVIRDGAPVEEENKEEISETETETKVEETADETSVETEAAAETESVETEEVPQEEDSKKEKEPTE